MRQNNRATGRFYEEQASAFLNGLGYKILEHNFYCRSGEIDLIARDGRYLVFIEVKYRATGERGDPAESVDLKKQKKIINTARYYLLTHNYEECIPCRFDVVAILKNEIRVIKDAFYGT
ncbi:MAG: YraN family protein [Clostridium sp.]